jgi:hypothetical protein
MYTLPPKNIRGFSLIETLVAVSIMMLSVAGPLSVASRGLISAQFARDQITAFHLAREATELVRSRRDSNTLNEDAWTGGMDACFVGECMVDPRDGNILFELCSGGVCEPLSYHETTGMYAYEGGVGWEQSRFTRTITMEEAIPGREIGVTVTVAWHTGVLQREFTITEHFFNWRNDI